jgi:MATE family multidrug resistance protein
MDDPLSSNLGGRLVMERNIEEIEFAPEVADRSRLARELEPMLRLAVPVVLAELGWMAMGIVDTIVVGRLGATATGSVGLGHNLHIAVTIFGLGLLLGLDTMVSQEHGAGLEDETRRSLTQGVYLGVVLTPLLMLLVLGMIPYLEGWGIRSSVLNLTVPYLRALVWSTGPLMIYGAFRRYLQGVGLVKPITFALLTANAVNLVAAWALVYGHLGFRAMGVEGSGWATCVARVYMMSVGIAAFLLYGRGSASPIFRWPRPEWAKLRRLIALGLPASMQVTLEVGVFATATALAGRLDPSSLASHHIVLQVSSLTFMVPLGIASAGAVRVGQALGRGDPRAASTSGWTAILIGAAFMACSGVALITMSGPIIGVFTEDKAVIASTTRLFALAAAFQLFDGIQVVATGVLRGAGETRLPMVCNLVAHWGIGLPIGYALGFGLGNGIVGLWVGLSIGLVVAGLVNLATWSRKASRLRTGLEQVVIA